MHFEMEFYSIETFDLKNIIFSVNSCHQEYFYIVVKSIIYNASTPSVHYISENGETTRG